jgi:hypothetical protein
MSTDAHATEFAGTMIVARHYAAVAVQAQRRQTRAAAHALGHFLRWHLPKFDHLVLIADDEGSGGVEVDRYVYDDHWLSAVEAWNVQNELHDHDRVQAGDHRVFDFLVQIEAILDGVPQALLEETVQMPMAEPLLGTACWLVSIDDLCNVEAIEP